MKITSFNSCRKEIETGFFWIERETALLIVIWRLSIEAMEAAKIEGVAFTTSPNRSYKNGVLPLNL